MAQRGWLQAAPAGQRLPHGSGLDFLWRLGGKVGGTEEELDVAAAVDASVLQKLAVISLLLSSPPSLPPSPPAGFLPATAAPSTAPLCFLTVN